MSDDVLKALLPALGMAAFERRADGSFAALAPLPRWFERIAGDGTFPFLGHILEEAAFYWNKGGDKLREWGPCAETDEAGREFHYMVTALTLSGRSVLVFALDTASDRIRGVLQKVRQQALSAEQRAEGEQSS